MIVNTLTADANRRVYHPLPVEIRTVYVCQLRLVAWQQDRIIYSHLPTTTRSMATGMNNLLPFAIYDS